jgi:hypothetical protein
MTTRLRNYGTSNDFSEGHRRCLPGSFCLFDIDGFLLDQNGDPKYIYEGKYKMETKDRGNFIEKFFDRKNVQATLLRIISHKIKVYICEESTNKWWELENSELKECPNPQLDLFKTENRIYVEDIITDRHSISSVFLRTEGEKPCSLDPFADYLSDMLETKKILVNDIHERGKIYLKDNDTTVTCELNEDYEGDWYEEWESLDLV